APRVLELGVIWPEVRSGPDTIGCLGDMARVDECLCHLQQLPCGLTVHGASSRLMRRPQFPDVDPAPDTGVLRVAVEHHHVRLMRNGETVCLARAREVHIFSVVER